MRFNIQHISTKEGVELVRRAKRVPGNRIHAEVTPHHLNLTEEAVIEMGSLAKLNPPFRTETDRQALIAGVKDGTIDYSYDKEVVPIVEQFCLQHPDFSFAGAKCMLAVNCLIQTRITVMRRFRAAVTRSCILLSGTWYRENITKKNGLSTAITAVFMTYGATDFTVKTICLYKLSKSFR